MTVVRQAGALLLAALSMSRGLFAQDAAARDTLAAPAVVTTVPAASSPAASMEIRRRIIAVPFVILLPVLFSGLACRA